MMQMKKHSFRNYLLMVLLVLSLVLSSCAGMSTTTSKEAEGTQDATSTTETVKDTSEPTEATTTAESSETTTEATTSETTASTEESETEPSETVAPAADSYFEVHFIDVGQGDANLIICDGEAMLIDGGPSDQSDLIYSYLEEHDLDTLKYIVATHPDDDHLGGLNGALNYATVERAFCNVDEYDSKPFVSFLKYLNQQKVTLEIPEPGLCVELGSAKVWFIGPLEYSEEMNNMSLIVRIEYGENSFLFMGDAEFEEEWSLINSDFEFESDVIKIAHHGSSNSSSDTFIEIVDPEYAVISCGVDNQYGFPKQEVLNILALQEILLYRTDLHGTIIMRSDGKNISFETERDTDDDVYLAPVLIDPAPSDELEYDYVINTNTGKFHYPNCDSVKQMREKNKEYYSGTREELIEMGYSPCGNCHP